MSTEWRWPDVPADPDDVAIGTCTNLIFCGMTPRITFELDAIVQAGAIVITDVDKKRFYARIPILPMKIPTGHEQLYADAIIKLAEKGVEALKRAREQS